MLRGVSMADEVKITFKDGTYVVYGSGFVAPYPPTTAGRPEIKSDDEIVEDVVNGLHERRYESARAAISVHLQNESENKRTTSMERLRKKVRKKLQQKT